MIKLLKKWLRALGEPRRFPMPDADAIRSLDALLDECGLNEIVYQVGDELYRVSRGRLVSTPPADIPADTPHASPVPDISLVTNAETIVTSQWVGIADLFPAAETEPYIRVNGIVREGQLLMTVEMLGHHHDVCAPHDGIITALPILAVKDLVAEWGAPLVKIRRAQLLDQVA